MEPTKQKKIRGIIPPLVTPLKDDDTLDLYGLEKLIEHTISGGVHGVFILGTTGEFASLGTRLKKELIGHTCQMVKGRIPVLVGISDTSISETLDLAETSARFNADAVVVTVPYYYSITQPELLEYLHHLTSRISLPLFIYNMPAHTKVQFDVETVAAAARIPGIAGMKDSSSDLAYFKQVQYALKDREDFILMVGPEEFMSEFVLMGGHGGLNGGANMFPKLYVELYDASRQRDFKKIVILQQKVMQISSSIYNVGHSSTSYLKGLKCALSLMGICSDFMASPLLRFQKAERKVIQERLEELSYTELL